MRGAGIITLQIVVAGVLLAVISGLIGFLVIHFTGWAGGSAATGVGWGMIVGGGLVGFAAGGSGSPSENLAGGRSGLMGTYWGESSPLPQSPLQVMLAGALVFGAGVAIVVLTY